MDEYREGYGSNEDAQFPLPEATLSDSNIPVRENG